MCLLNTVTELMQGESVNAQENNTLDDDSEQVKIRVIQRSEMWTTERVEFAERNGCHDDGEAVISSWETSDPDALG